MSSNPDLDHLRSVQLNKPKAKNKNLPASRTTVSKKAGTKEAKKRKMPGRTKPSLSNIINIASRLSSITNIAD